MGVWPAPNAIEDGHKPGCCFTQATGEVELVESVDKPGSVVDDHSSATGVTACL